MTAEAPAFASCFAKTLMVSSIICPIPPTRRSWPVSFMAKLEPDTIESNSLVIMGLLPVCVKSLFLSGLVRMLIEIEAGHMPRAS
jgi:hypothetical protein